MLSPSHLHALAMCDGHGAGCAHHGVVPGSEDPNPSAPHGGALWMQIGAGKQSSVPCGMSLGFSKPEWCELGLSWLVGPSSLCFSFHVVILALPKGVAHTREAAFPGQCFGLQSQSVLCCSHLALGFMW